MKPTMNALNDQNPAFCSMPADIADVALADINDLRALTRMSASWIYDAVRKGEFPAPAIRESRCTRWRLADVRSYLVS